MHRAPAREPRTAPRWPPAEQRSTGVQHRPAILPLHKDYLSYRGFALLGILSLIWNGYIRGLTVAKRDEEG